MKLSSVFVFGSVLLTSSAAFAAVNLTTSIAAPSGVHVYQTGTYNVTVTNNGSAQVNAVSLTITLPTTNTSPQVYVMGTLGAKSLSCLPSGTNLVCSLGNIKKTKSVTVFFNIAIPEAAETLEISATALPTDSTPNNVATHVVNLLNYNVTTGPAGNVTNRHCTGTGLTSFFECEKFPSSIASHESVLLADNTITFPDQPDYWGDWTQVVPGGSYSPQYLAFNYYSIDGLEAEFEGWGVDGNCFEGLTTFPLSTYVSPYEVCFHP